MKQGDKKLKRREEKLAEKVAELKLATQLAETRRTEKKKELSRKLHVLQICLHDVKRCLKLALGWCQQLKQQHPDPKSEVPNPAAPDEFPILRLKDDKGHKSEAVTCVMMLVGECEVAPSRCGAVIQAVASHVFHATVPDSDLPSTHSALCFADRGHVLSKLQLSEALLEGDA